MVRKSGKNREIINKIGEDGITLFRKLVINFCVNLPKWVNLKAKLFDKPMSC